MHKQYKILKQEFKINPDILSFMLIKLILEMNFAGIDIKRFMIKKVSLKELSREKFTRATYDYSKTYIFSELNDLSVFKKIIKFPI